MSESDADKMSRVRAMIDDNGCTWDLSRNDKAALKFVLVSLDAAESALAAVARERDESDTTRREWEVRAATSYRDGRAAGLREAAGVCAKTIDRLTERLNADIDHADVWARLDSRRDALETARARILAILGPGEVDS